MENLIKNIVWLDNNKEHIIKDITGKNKDLTKKILEKIVWLDKNKKNIIDDIKVHKANDDEEDDDEEDDDEEDDEEDDDDEEIKEDFLNKIAKFFGSKSTLNEKQLSRLIIKNSDLSIFEKLKNYIDKSCKKNNEYCLEKKELYCKHFFLSESKEYGIPRIILYSYISEDDYDVPEEYQDNMIDMFSDYFPFLKIDFDPEEKKLALRLLKQIINGYMNKIIN